MSRRGRPQKPLAEWNFRTFPVLFAFALGALLATLLYPVALIVFILSLFGVSFGVAHMLSRWLRERTVRQREAQADEAERERRALATRAAREREAEGAAPERRRRRRRG